MYPCHFLFKSFCYTFLKQHHSQEDAAHWLKDWKSPCSTPEALLLKDIHIHLVVSLRQTHDPMKLWFRRKTKKKSWSVYQSVMHSSQSYSIALSWPILPSLALLQMPSFVLWLPLSEHKLWMFEDREVLFFATCSSAIAKFSHFSFILL